MHGTNLGVNLKGCQSSAPKGQLVVTLGRSGQAGPVGPALCGPVGDAGRRAGRDYGGVGSNRSPARRPAGGVSQRDNGSWQLTMHRFVFQGSGMKTPTRLTARRHVDLMRVASAGCH
ncbi:putative leader peptide [Kitasatospora sp. NPDC088548]|uniref:putative leader peptide n=1 Tax=Kitasatospora sp. NPDC088548 TaxID=3364075 RepID=UPI00380B7FE2